MKKLLILVFLTIPLFLFLNSNYASATNSLEATDDISSDNIELSEDYQNGYRQGYEDGFSHKTRIKIALWQHDTLFVDELDTVYRYRFGGNFISRYNIKSPTGLTVEERRNLAFIPTFNGHVGGFITSVRQWLMTDDRQFYLYVEKSIIQSIMSRDNVNEITALKIYLEENNIYGYFERANGLTDYEIGFNNGYEQGFNNAMKETTTKLMSSILILISPILLISVILQMLNKFKNDN